MAKEKHPTVKTMLSIIITAHAEGILMHRTLKSALRAARKLDERKIPWELLIHVDNGTADMLDYIQANQEFLKPFTIYYNSFKDLGASRNFMVSKAAGDNIAFLDADDLVSESWFADAIDFTHKQKRPAVLHTEWLINFGRQNLVWHKRDSLSKEEDAIIMVWANRWDSAVIAPRGVFETFPYSANVKGFGSEDWHFGSQTRAAGIPHYVVPRTILFARRKDVSEMSIQLTDFRTVQYTDLLDLKFIKQIDIDRVLPSKPADNPASQTALITNKLRGLSIKAAKRTYHLTAERPLIGPFIQAAKANAIKLRDNRRPERFPEWLVTEWRDMHVIDKGVFPDEELLPVIPQYISEMYEMGIAFHKLSQYVTKLPDYVIVAPHLVAGGADLVILNYVRTLQELHPDWHILVITTNDTPSPWAERLPKNVDYMPFGAACTAAGVWQDLHLQLFARLIVQLRTKKIHIIQSALGFLFAEKYKSLLSNNDYSVYACAFCEDIDDDGRFIGHIHSGLPYAYPVLKHILTDNQAVVDQLSTEYGFDPQRMTVHYQPAEITELTPPKQRTAVPCRILWASRVTKQKRPDIMRRIAERLDPEKYIIDAYGSLHNDFTAEYFEDVPALNYKGSFNGLGSIDTSAYDIFLYTSANDGVPNILLGAAACGLPVIASDAGGVGEFIRDGKTGRLINPIEDIGAYVTAIEQLAAQPDKAAEFASNAQVLLRTQHDQSTFMRAVKEAEL